MIKNRIMSQGGGSKSITYYLNGTLLILFNRHRSRLTLENPSPPPPWHLVTLSRNRCYANEKEKFRDLLKLFSEKKYYILYFMGVDILIESTVYVAGNISNPALPVMPRQYQNFHYCQGSIRNLRHYP